MSIYVLRYGNLVKIGFSSDLPSRVKNIMASIPGEVTFVGHMPGDRDVEAHLHSTFEGQRFSGEWFLSSPPLEALFATLLIADLPVPAIRPAPNRLPEVEQTLRQTCKALRAWSAARWPQLNHRKRIAAISELLPAWRASRVQSIYNAERKCSIKPHETRQLETLMAPELTSPTGAGNSNTRVEK